MNTSVIIEPVTRRRRRRYSEEFKAEVIRACQHPGISIAAVALANGLNANLLRRWVANAERDMQPMIEATSMINAQPTQTPAFLPLQLAAPTREPPPARRHLSWPVRRGVDFFLQSFFFRAVGAWPDCAERLR